MVSLYNLFMTPLEKLGIRNRRKYLMKDVAGHVLEIGVGTGANLAFVSYDNISSYTLTDKKQSKHLKVKEPLRFEQATAENLPFANATFDVVIHTLVFCSVDNVDMGLKEIKRVLKPGGVLLFIEHVLPNKKTTRRLFKFINPLWQTFSGGCSLIRDYRGNLMKNDFCIIEEGYFFGNVFYYGKAKISSEM